MFNRKLLSVVIAVVLSLGVVQVAFAGVAASVDTVTVSCVGDDVLIDIQAIGLGWSANIVWIGPPSGSDSTGSVVSASGTYTIVGPGSFSIVVEDPAYQEIFDFDIACPSGGVVSETSEDRIELCADGRTNSNLCDPLAIYPVESDDGVGMLIYRTSRDNGGIGQFALYVPAEELDSLPASVDEACTIDASADGSVVVYLLSSGEIQVNTGPDEEGKFFVFRYESFPSMPEVETYSGGGSLPIFPSCWDETDVGFGIFNMPI